jgi:hypothetical protein
VAGGSDRKASAYDDQHGIPPPSICRREHGASGTVRHDESMHATERSQAPSVMGALAKPHDRSGLRLGRRLGRASTEHGAPPPRRTRASTQVKTPRRSHAARRGGSSEADVRTTQPPPASGCARHHLTGALAAAPPNGSKSTGSRRSDDGQIAREAEQATGKSGEGRKGRSSR